MTHRERLMISVLGALIATAAGCSKDDPEQMTEGANMVLPPGQQVATAGSTGAAAAGSSATMTNTDPPPNNMQPSAGTMAVGMAGTGAVMMPPPNDMMPAAGSMAPPMDMMPTPRSGETCLQAGSGGYGEPGPYQVGTMEIDLGMIQATQNSGKFMIYYPNPLEASCPHPIVAWGNGTTVTDPAVYAFFNQNAASWGIVVAAAFEDNAGSGEFHKAGLDWLLAENAKPDSIFYQKLSTRAGVSGHSQGAFGASAGSSHPNVEATVAVGGTASSSMKVSVLTLTGTEDIVMNPASIAERAQGKAFVASWEGGDHFSTETVAGYIGGDKGTLQMQRLYAAWFRCFLGDDQVACDLFYGGTPDGCGICGDPGWAVLASKNMD